MITVDLANFKYELNIICRDLTMGRYSVGEADHLAEQTIALYMEDLPRDTAEDIDIWIEQNRKLHKMKYTALNKALKG